MLKCDLCPLGGALQETANRYLVYYSGQFVLLLRMSHRGLITLPPTRWDLVLSRACAREATPEIERTLRVVTWLADEKIVLGATLLFWTYVRLSRRDIEIVRRADHMLCSVALAGMLPHLFKRLIDRKRPDRVVVHGRRQGIPRSGNAWDSFPSGHALHLGAIAGSVVRFCPHRFRRLVWPSIIALAATRILLLAHYLSDVVTGLAVGVALDRVVGRLFGERHAASSGHCLNGLHPVLVTADDGLPGRRARWPRHRSN